jgi:hypothetical protein
MFTRRPDGNATGINFYSGELTGSGWNSCVSWCSERLVRGCGHFATE